MNPTTADDHALKLSVDNDNLIWYLEGDGLPRHSNNEVDQFLDGRILRQYDHVRVVGLAANSVLLLRLFELKQRGFLKSLEVCSPLCCESAEDRRDPEVVLFNMRDYRLAASLGGWHEFSGRDAMSYLLAAHFQRSREVTDEQRRVLLRHPAWPALRFIKPLDSDACCKLLGLLIDPRWYIDSDEPNRSGKIEQFLGLNPTAQAANECADEPWSHERCRLVQSCWRVGQVPGRIQDMNARHFLWRAWLGRGGGLKGDLAASKLFISFLRQTWTEALCDGPKRGRLFVPEYFFAGKDEAEAFKTHMKKGDGYDGKEPHSADG